MSQLKANSHRHTRHDKLSCLCRVRFGGVNWIPGNSTLSATEKKYEVCSLNTFRVRAMVQFTSAHQTRHRQDRFVMSGVAV